MLRAEAKTAGNIMKIRHIQSLDIWLLSKGDRVLYRGRHNPWHSERVLKGALRREGVKVAA